MDALCGACLNLRAKCLWDLLLAKSHVRDDERAQLNKAQLRASGLASYYSHADDAELPSTISALKL